MDKNKLTEEKKNSTKVYSGPLLQVYHDRVTLPDGKESGRDLIRHVGAVAIVPVTDDGRVIVEYQYRYPTAQILTEIPAGKLDSIDEDRLEAAKRELLEETGITADKWQNLGFFYSAPAYSDEKISIYLATGLHMNGKQNLDDDEFLVYEAVPFADILKQVENGEIPDGKTQTGLLRAARILGY